MPEEGTAQTTESTPEAKTEKVYGQSDVDAITEKVRKSEEAKRTPLEKQIQALTEKVNGLTKQNETEAEKQLREQTDRLEAARKEALEQGMKMGDLRGYLRSVLPKDAKPETVQTLAKQVNELAGEWADPIEAVKAFEAQTGLNLTTKRDLGGLGGRNTTTAEGQRYDADSVTAALRGKTPLEQQEWWAKHGKNVLETQRKAAGAIQVLPPGAGLPDMQPAQEVKYRSK